MKKFLLKSIIYLAVTITTSVMGQTASDTIQNAKFVFCDIIGCPAVNGTKLTLTIDYGLDIALFPDTKTRDEETGKVESYSSIVDALNYMENNGWIFVQAYTVTTSAQRNYYHWLLKKKKN